LGTSTTHVQQLFAEYGDHGREDRSKTRFWLGLAFSSWRGIRDFLKAVPVIPPVQYYGGAKSRSMVHAPRQRISSWVSTENLDKVGIESSYGRYYLGKYFKEVLSARALPPMNRFIAFGDAILRATELARATRTKELRKWGKKSWQEVLNRPDQANFRKRLLQAYGKVRHLRIRRGWSSDCCAYQAIQEVTGART
jgi:hypothetical protein